MYTLIFGFISEDKQVAFVPDFPATVDQRLMPEGDHHPLGQVVGSL